MAGRRELTFDPGPDDASLWEGVLGYYHRCLAASVEAAAWLSAAGVTSAEVVAEFGVGFCDRTLGLSIPKAVTVAGGRIRGRLGELGVFRESGHERFRGCVVVPVRDRDGRVVQCYGRRVNPPKPNQRGRGTEPTEVMWLPGPSTGIWNSAAADASAELIVAGSVLDGLVWASAGYRHVIAPGGPDGLPQDLGGRLVDAGVTRVLLATERSAGGEQAANAVHGSLAGFGLECYRVVFPAGCDASSVATEADDATVALGERLRSALWLGEGPAPVRRDHRPTGDGPALPASPRQVNGPRTMPASRGPRSERPAAPSVDQEGPRPEDRDSAVPNVIASPVPPAPPAGRDVEVDGGEMRVTIGKLAWRVRGLDQVTGPGSLRVNVHVHRLDDGGFHLDVVDLFSARARAGFVKAAAMELGADEERVRRDLGRVLLACEDRVLDLQAQARQPVAEVPAMTAAEQDAALELLADPKLLERISDDIAALGVVGEADNALVAYLAATSRLLDTPLAVVVQSGSAAGKSTLVDAVLSLMPEEARLQVSAMTGQSLFYLGETELVHKVLSIAEAEGAARASYALKLLQSDGELSIASTGKDPVSGQLVTRTYRVRGPVALFLTTTAPSLDDELANRAVILGVDEDQAQTRAILAAQRQSQTIAGLLACHERDELRMLHANAQRLLEPVAVVNPLAPSLSFADGRTRARRDHAKFLTLIRAVALLHQHQRPRKRVTRHGVEVVYIEATTDDVAVAERLAPLLFGGPAVADLAPQTRRLLALLHVLVSEEASRDRCRREDIRFTRRQAREHCGWSDYALRRHLDRLVELELVMAHRSGNAFTYELLWSEADTDRDSSDEVGGEVRNYDPDLAGSRGVSRPSRGHLAVVSRPAGS